MADLMQTHLIPINSYKATQPTRWLGPKSIGRSFFLLELEGSAERRVQVRRMESTKRKVIW